LGNLRESDCKAYLSQEGKSCILGCLEQASPGTRGVQAGQLLTANNCQQLLTTKLQ